MKSPYPYFNRGAMIFIFTLLATSFSYLASAQGINEEELKVLKANSEAAAYLKTIAEAQRAERLAKIPPSDTKALKGTIDLKNYGSAGLVVAIDLADKVGERLCKVIDDNRKVTIYDKATVTGIVSARLINTYIKYYQGLLDENKKLVDIKKTPPVWGKNGVTTLSFGLEFGITALTGTVRAVADLTSLFKTDITINSTAVPNSKAILLTAMAHYCKEKITFLGIGYSGELLNDQYEYLKNAVLQLKYDKVSLDIRIVQITQELKSADGEIKDKLQKQFVKLSTVAVVVDKFLKVLLPDNISVDSPLSVAARFLYLDKRTTDSDILDINFTLEGLTSIKNNIFTGQKLQLSATSITRYILYNTDGSIKKAEIWREMAKPVHMKLKGNEVDGRYWSTHKREPDKKKSDNYVE